MAVLGREEVFRKVILSVEISKVVLCLLVAFSSLFGYIFASQAISFEALSVFFAVFLLACGGASLNSYQERHHDRLMARTEKRPLVQSQLSNGHALLQSFLLISTGLISILLFFNIKVFGAALAGILIYNGIYTRMKSWSLYAIIPGAVCGAIPPYIGWLAAGGAGFSFHAALPILLLFFWQVPHVFLIVLNHKSDYSGGISPNILKLLSEDALRRISLPWITALATIMLTFTTLPSSLNDGARTLVVINAVLLLGLFYHLMLCAKSPNYRLLFICLNFSLFFMMMIICLGSIV